MKQPLLLTTLCLLGVASYSATGADVTGKVTLKGTPKPEITINMASDPKCGALHTKPVTTRHYVVGKDNGLANVMVYVKSGLSGKSFPAPTDTPLLDQVGCEYIPYVMGVRTGQTFKVKNSDPTLHNVHATPVPASGNKEFNFAQPIKDMVTEKSFPNPEIALRFKCDVHPWMFAYVSVLDHPYFAVTDADGNFKITGLPPGKYTLAAHHVKTHRNDPGVEKEIAVDGNTNVEFVIEAN